MYYKSFMKNLISILFFFPLVSLAVELHPQDECESYKNSLSNSVANLQISADTLHTDIGYVTYAYIDIGLARQDFNYKASIGTDSVRDAYRYCADSIYLDRAQSDVSNSYFSLESDYSIITNNLSSLKLLVSDVDCTQCSISNSSSCCDFTDIISAINSCKSELVALGATTSQILQQLYSNLPLIRQSLSDIDSHITLGFYDVTQLVQSCNITLTNMLYHISSGFTSVTNYLDLMYIPQYKDEWLWQYPEMLTKLRYPSYINGQFDRFYSDLSYFNNDKWGYGAYMYGLTPTFYLMVQEILGGIYAQNGWTQYQHDYMFPPITNTLIQIHQSTTNFFTFYRDEIGVRGVLSSWTPDRGTYYDYLTNHYLSVVMGDSLSAEYSSNTNWFSRVESLLAALVFVDSKSTNTVSTSSYQREQSQIQDSFDSIVHSSDNSYLVVRSNVNDILDLYRSYTSLYDSVSMPNHIVLFTLSNTDSESDVVSFSMDENPLLSLFVESLRAITTFSWASVGIFLLLRFVFWAGKGIYYACKFMFSVISSIFK